MKDFVFIYGTLSPGRAPPEIRETIARLNPVSAGSMPGRIYALGDFPGAVYDGTASTRVHGEVFEIPSDTHILGALDSYEEFVPDDRQKSLFVREKRPIDLADGTRRSCWVYLYNRNPQNAPVISSGSYSDWIAINQSTHS
jgi:gamma-glutamylcyclotransferase (GGCT)/AIG2-like uncharacterized protein YtfP